jgi:hypothetical protein
VCISILYPCGFAAADECPGRLDPDIREDLRRCIDQRHPDLDSKAKRAILRQIEQTPKIRCTITAVTVYNDGIVCRATLSSDLPFDCRLSLLGRSLSPVCSAQLLDGQKYEWRVPPLKRHYQFAPVEEPWTVLIPQGKTVSLTFVDQLESPRPVRLKPLADGKTPRPTEFRYVIAGYSIAYTADLRKQESVYLIGRGKTPVKWMQSLVPPGKETGVAQSQKRGCLGLEPWEAPAPGTRADRTGRVTDPGSGRYTEGKDGTVRRPTMSASEPHRNLEEIARQGMEMFDCLVRPALRPEDRNKFVAISIETGDYELDEDDYAAVTRLRKRFPSAEIWLGRVDQSATCRMRGSR